MAGNKIPKSADELLFAVDIVSYFFRKQCSDKMHEFSSLPVVSQAEGYRKTASFTFNQHVEYMLDEINESQADSVQQDFLNMLSDCKQEILELVPFPSKTKDFTLFISDSQKSSIYCSTFLKYCNACRHYFLIQDNPISRPRQTLLYCARMASTACHFYMHSVPDVLPLAINTIRSDLHDFKSMSILASEFAEPKSAQVLTPWRDRADLFNSESEGNSSDSTSMSEDSEKQPVLRREASDTSISEASSAGVESVTARMSRLRVASSGSSYASSSSSDPSPTSETEASISNPAKTSDFLGEENVEDFPPKNADQLIFATDIIFFFFRRQCKDMNKELFSLDLVNKVGRYRRTARVKFNDNVKEMLDVIDQTQTLLVKRDFQELLKHRKVNKKGFPEYCRTIRACFLFEYIQPKHLLTYCARVASMACNYFKQNVPEALPMAIEVIALELSDESMSSLAGNRTECVDDYATGAGYSASDPSPMSEDDAIGLWKTRAVIESNINRENALDVPSTSTTGGSPRLGKRASPAKYDNVDDSRGLGLESSEETFPSGGGKHQKMN